MKNIILKYYFKITALCALSGLLVGCSGLKVMIETERPDDDFVIVCSWASKNFKIHGGKYEVKRNIFVASSDEIIDCGTSFWGEGPLVEVFHPLYMGASGCENRALCNKPYYRIDKEMVIIFPLLAEEYLDGLIKNLKNKDLIRVSINRLAGGFSDGYLSKYDSVKKIELGYFKSKYEVRLNKYWNKLLPIIVDEIRKRGLENYTVEGAISNYWERIKELENVRGDQYED